MPAVRQAALLALLQGAVLVHHLPLILSDLGFSASAAVASSRFGDGELFLWHTAASAALLLLPAGLFVAADAIARRIEPTNPFEAAAGSAVAPAGTATWGERLTRVAYGSTSPAVFSHIFIFRPLFPSFVFPSSLLTFFLILLAPFMHSFNSSGGVCQSR